MVKINEFFDNKIDDTLPFNVIDDLSIFMRNDPMFYRKEFYPLLMKMKSAYDNKKKFNVANEIVPVINKASAIYCKKFGIPKDPKELLDKDEKTSLVNKLYSEEMTNIRKGTY